MADSKISALPTATTPLAGTEVLPIVQSGVTDQVTVANLTAGRAVATAALNATGIISTTDATDASSTTAASLKTAGGLGVVKKTYVGDNIVQATAAKGFDFAANTTLSGKTSTILNWYEEGTWTPNITAGSGTFTSVSATGKYTRIGRLVTTAFTINITTNGTAASYIKISMPIANGSTQYCGIAVEQLNTGNTCSVQFGVGATTANISSYNNGYPGGTGYQITGTLTYSI
jgi:hypothetical protein